MLKKITHVAIMVRDIKAALKFYTETLGLEKRADSPMGEGEHARWVTVGPKEQPEMEIVLQHYSWGPEGDAGSRQAVIGQQPGFIFEVDDIEKVVADLKGKGVTIAMEPTQYDWGTQAVIHDLYGNSHVISQPPAG